MRKITPTAEQFSFIEFAYYNQKLSCRQIAERLPFSADVVERILRDYFYGVRSVSENQSLRTAGNIGSKRTPEALAKMRKSWFEKRSSNPQYIKLIALAKQGEKNAAAKLTASQVDEIRASYDQIISSGITVTGAQRLMASKYHVSRSTISDIVHRRTWVHLLRDD